MLKKLIGIFDEKIEEADEDFHLYILKYCMLKEDFDNGEIKGFDYFGTKFFHTLYDLESFPIPGIDDKQIEFMDSLEEGDVIVFDANLFISFHHGDYSIAHEFLEISNYEKYDDKYAADEIKLIVSEAPHYNVFDYDL